MTSSSSSSPAATATATAGIMLWALTWIVVVVSTCSFPSIHAFVIPATKSTTTTPTTIERTSRSLRQQSTAVTSLSLTTSSSHNSKNVVIVSPPGGVGEVAAVKAACSGSNVRWFVVKNNNGGSENEGGSSNNNDDVSLSSQTLQDISLANGSLELAGATIDELSQGGDALAAVATWCSGGGGTGAGQKIDGLICTYDDGIVNSGSSDRQRIKKRDPFQLQELAAAVRLAAKEAAKGVSVSAPRVAVLAAEEELLADIFVGGGDDNNKDEKIGGGFLGSLFGKSVPVPPTLTNAIAASSSSGSSSSKSNICVIRHGELFGMPESSPEFSPLVGGPKRQPVITEEYMMRTVRVDPFVVSGNVMSASSTSRTCRHCLGEAAALFATGALPILSQSVSISSQVGTEEFTIDLWQQELERVQDLIKSGQASTLFSQEMIVDDTERLADWLATKWAPAVLRTYDIAAIRIGARPVYATRPGVKGDGLVEIAWQELVNFDSVMVGKMFLQVTKDGIRATRGSGDPSKGYGSISPLPLPGEDVLVRRLAEAASQAVDKGLAKKALMKKPTKSASSSSIPVPVTSLQAAGDVEPAAAATATAMATAMAPAPAAVVEQKQEESKKSSPPQTGPRQAGARRSTPRSRGSSTSTNKKSNE